MQIFVEFCKDVRVFLYLDDFFEYWLITSFKIYREKVAVTTHQCSYQLLRITKQIQKASVSIQYLMDKVL